MEQEVLRAKLNTYIYESGVKAKFIAQRISVDESILCRFRRGLKDLYPENLRALRQFLER